MYTVLCLNKLFQNVYNALRYSLFTTKQSHIELYHIQQVMLDITYWTQSYLPLFGKIVGSAAPISYLSNCPNFISGYNHHSTLS